MTLFTTSIVLAVFLFIGALASDSCPKDPILDTENGSVAGVCKRVKIDNEKWDNVYSWLSIPYAKPPVGDLRFQEPQSYGSWAGNLDGSKYPSFCMNIHYKTTHTPSEYLSSLFGSSGVHLSEDCLYLNIFMSEKVYKSRTSSSPTPILVYFQNGNQNLFNPASLVIDHDIIFISINYRLDVFGFLHIKDDESSKDNLAGNQAILDQNMALKWINENAGKFGGDSSRETLLGMDYGANLIGYQMMYKPSFSFFRNVILNSGTPINLAKNTITTQLATARAKTFIKDVLKCKSGSSLLQCARRIDAYNLTMASRFYLHNKMSHQNKLTSNSLYSAFGPVADGRMFSDSAIRAFRLGHFKKCNVLTGYKTYDSFTVIPFDFHHSPMIRQEPNKRETISFSGLVQAVKKYYSFYPTHPFNNTDVLLDTILIQYTRLFEKSHFEHPSLIKINYYPTFFKLVNDEAFACPTLKMIDHVARYSRVYVYINDVPDRKLVNNSMVGFMLSKPGVVSDVNDEMNERWANFVKYDSPNSNSSNITWPHYLPYDNSQDTLLDDSMSDCANNQTSNSTQLYLSLSTKGISVKSMKSTDNCIVWNTLIPATMDSLAELKKDLASKCPKSDKKQDKKSNSFFKKFKLF